MTQHTILTTPRFERAVKKLDPPTAKTILNALKKLQTHPEPQALCKPLTKPLQGLWRLRVGDYRIILDIRAHALTIIALDVGHRSTIYR